MYYIILYYIILYYIIYLLRLYYILLYYIVLDCIVLLYYIISCYIILYCIVWYCIIILFYIILYHIIYIYTIFHILLQFWDFSIIHPYEWQTAWSTSRGPWQIWVDRVLSAYPLLTLLGGIALPAGFSVAGPAARPAMMWCRYIYIHFCISTHI